MFENIPERVRGLLTITPEEEGGHWIWGGTRSRGVRHKTARGRPFEEARLGVPDENGKRKIVQAKRYLWALVREDPVPRWVEKTCGVAWCVNPNHYRETVPGTKLRNSLSQEELEAILSCASNKREGDANEWTV